MAVPYPRDLIAEYPTVWNAVCWVSAGEAWPTGDEDQMRELAEAWKGLAETINDALLEADPAVLKILQNWGGDSGEAFGQLWNQLAIDPGAGLPLIQEAAAAFAHGAENAAMEIEYAKLTILIAFLITVISVFVALLMAWLGGVSAAGIPAILAAGRQAVTVAVRRLVAQMGRQLFTRAGMHAALRNVGMQVGQRLTREGLGHAGRRFALELAEEVSEELIIDVTAQAYQINAGTRAEWDVRRTGTAALGGAFGAVLGTGLKAGTRFARNNLAPRMPISFSPPAVDFRGAGIARWGGRTLAAGTQNAIVSPAASVLANRVMTGEWSMPGGDAVLGGFASGAGRGGATMAASSGGSALAHLHNKLAGLDPSAVKGAGLDTGPSNVPTTGLGSISLAPPPAFDPASLDGVGQVGVGADAVAGSVSPSSMAGDPQGGSSKLDGSIVVGQSAAPTIHSALSPFADDSVGDDSTADSAQHAPISPDSEPAVVPVVASSAPAAVGPTAGLLPTTPAAGGAVANPTVAGTPALATAQSSPAVSPSGSTSGTSASVAGGSSQTGSPQTAAGPGTQTGTRTPPASGPPVPTGNPRAPNSAGSVSLGPATTPTASVPTSKLTPTVPAATGASPSTTPDPANRVPTQRVSVDGAMPASAPSHTGAPTTGTPNSPIGGNETSVPTEACRSTGPTGGNTHSWQGKSFTVTGDPNGREAKRTLIEASRRLAEAVRTAVKGKTISKGKMPGMAGALMMPNGEVTTHTSMTADKGTKPPTQPAVHPVVQDALDRIKADLEAMQDQGRSKGAGHGKCAEVALVSDQLYRLEGEWRQTGEPGTLEQYALNALSGAKIVTHQIKSAVEGGIEYDLGHYRPPCRSCRHLLPQFGIDSISDSERSPTNYQPPVPGVVGNGRPLSDERPYGEPEGLVPPEPAHQLALDDAVPRDPETGRPEVHPDPRVRSWVGKVNDGGPTVLGRSENCADVGLSFLSTWFGRPEVAAATVEGADLEHGSTARQEQALRSTFSYRGTGASGLDDIAVTLREAGHGSATLIIITSPTFRGRAHTWNAVNHNDAIVWVDAQANAVSATGPIYRAGIGDVWSITLDAEGDPFPSGQPQSDTDAPAIEPVPVPPHSTAPAEGQRPDDSVGGRAAGISGQSWGAENDYLGALSDAERATLLDELAAARSEATHILGELQSLAAGVNARLGLTGADALRTLGEEHRVKGAESLARKYRTTLATLGYDIGSALATVNDVVRFSLRGPESELYGPAVDNVLASLEERGYQVTNLKNFWRSGNRFFGLNCTLVSPGGRTFELQFPTATSYAIGKQTHVPYEVVRDPAQPAADRVHAFLDILAINKSQGAAARMPGGMEALRFGEANDSSFAKWIGASKRARLRKEYLDWLGQQPYAFADVCVERGLTASDLPGLDRDLIGETHGDADIRLLPPAAGPGRPAGQPDRERRHHGPDAGGDLGSVDRRVDVPSGRGGGVSVGGPGDGRGPGGGSGHRGTGDCSLHDGSVADGSGVDRDLSRGVAEVAPGRPEVAGPELLSVEPETNYGLPETRSMGPGKLAPLEDPRYQQDVALSLRTAEGYTYLADPFTHPYGRLINDGGPAEQGRGNNCLDCSLAALSSFYGDPQVAQPRWPDIRVGGSFETELGEDSGLTRAEEWLGGIWAGGSAGLPAAPTARAAAVSDQYARLYQRVAQSGPGSAALVVADWLGADDVTGELILDEEGGVTPDGAHAFILVYPSGVDRPVWWDPQHGVAMPEPPPAYVARTYALWSMMVPSGGGTNDGGRGTSADHSSAGDPKSGPAGRVRVRLGGSGGTLGGGASLGKARGSGAIHHRPDGRGDSPLEPAAPADSSAVRGSPPPRPLHGTTGLAEGGPAGLNPTDTESAATSVVPPLTAADVAELATVTHQLRTANTFSRVAVRRELTATVDRLGLRDGMLGAEQRMATLPAEVRAALAEVINQGSAHTSERSRLRPDRRTSEAKERPVGLPRMRTYVGTHLTVNSLLLTLATTFTLNAGGRPELALMLGAGAFVGAVTTGPTKWLAKRAGLAAEDRRARYDARQDARTAAEEDVATAAVLVAHTDDVTSTVQKLGAATTGLDGQVSAVQEQLRRDERRHRVMGPPRRFPSAGEDAPAVSDDSPGTGTSSAGAPGGSTAVGLTSRERERLAELRSLVARHDGARPWARFGVGREIRALLNSLGLRQGTPGVDHRRDLVPPDVRPLVERFGGSRTAVVRARARAVIDRYPADDQRPGTVAPWWMSAVENAPNLLTATTVAGVGDLLGQLRLGWFGIAGALAAAATGVAVDPVVARREAVAKDARDTWDADNPAVPAEALLSQAAEAVADPISAVADRAATAVRRTADLEQRLADLERRVTDSQRRNGLIDSFRRLLFGDPAWAGLPPSKDATPISKDATPASRASADPEASTDPAAEPSVGSRDPASLQQLAELAVRHGSVGPLARPSVARQLRFLIDRLGLREGTPGADQRRAQVPDELRPVVERHGQLGVTSRVITRFSRPPALATDSTERPSNMRSLRVFAVEQTLGPLVQAGTWVGVAQVSQIAAGAGPSKILAGGLLGPLRDLLLNRAETRVKDARRAWDLANPNPAMEPKTRAAGLAGPSATAVTSAVGQLDVASRRLDDITSTLDRLAQGHAAGPSDPAATPGIGEPLDVAGPASLNRADAWELQTAAHQVRTADALSLRPALRELHAVIDRLGLRAGMLGAPDRIAQLPGVARRVVAEFGGDRAGRARQLRTLRAQRRTAENTRPPGIPGLRTYLVSSGLTTAATAGAATAVAIAVASPLTPVIPIAAAVAAPVIGVSKWYARRRGLAADDVRSRFDARVDARGAADQVDQVVDRVNEPVAELERAANRLEGQLGAAESATDRLAERLAETHRRVGLLSRLFDIVGWGPTAPTGSNPEAGAVRESRGSPEDSPESGRITAAAVPNSGFHGLGRPVADPVAVLATAHAALPQVASYAGVDDIGPTGPNRFEIYAAGRFSFRVWLTTGPLTDGVVAQTTRNSDGSFTVTVSDRAVDGVVARALTHEIAELAALHDSRQILIGPLDPGTDDGLINPAGLTAHDQGRMAEIRLLAAEYEFAGPPTRLALRVEIDALANHLGLRLGDPAAPGRAAIIPRDVHAQLMRLSTPSVTQESVAEVLDGSPATEVEQRRWVDYRNQLVPDSQVPSTTELQARLHELAIQGEREQVSLPRMSAHAGQILHLPPAQLGLIRDVHPTLADRIAAEGVYVDLAGRFDLRPYALTDAPEFSLAESRSAFDLGAEVGRQSLLAEDRARGYVVIRAAFGARSAAMAMLHTHDLHYLTNARKLALVPGVLARALYALVPGAPPLDLEVTPTATAAEVTVIADRVTLPAGESGEPAPEYGRPRDLWTGQPAPLFDGPPKREQVQQGKLGDCGMLASMAAVAGHRPEAIAQLFQPNPDGTVDVLLHESTLLGDSIGPTGRRLRITVHPDVPIWDSVSGESAYADQSVIGSSWASLLEKALAAVDRTWSSDRHQQWQLTWAAWESPNDPLVAAPTGYARLDVGSHRQMQAELLTQLTGLPSRAASFDQTPGRETASEARLAALLAAGSPVITATRGEDQYPAAIRNQLPHGLVAGHAYEVVAVGNGQVQLHNPWNTRHPTPMTVREFLDLMNESFAYLEPPPTPPVQSSDPHTLGRTWLEELGYSIAYYALLAADGTVSGLVVSESSRRGQRTRHWMAAGAPSAPGSALPVDRTEAERIAREALGFTLPDEPALHDMLEG